MNTCTIEIANSPIGAFPCAPGQTVLQAAAAAGWQLPHSCGRGVCESCRATISGGDVTPAVDADGTALLCRVRPLSDIRIAPARAERVEPQATRNVAAKLYRVHMAAPDVAVVDLRFPAGVRVPFKAGQYLQVHLPEEEPRSFSIATPPRSSDAVQLHIRVLPGSRFGSVILPTLRPGDPVQVELPLGDFYLREGTQHVVMVAGGTGFAPMQSILEQTLAKQPQRRFTLYWGARGNEGLYALEQVRRWQQRHANFSFVGVVSEEPAQAPLRAGPVHEAVLADFASLADCQVYACGAPPMVAAAREQFVQRRALPPSNFFSDAFASPTQPSP
jgi:NAD(P)H-flavin reductase/ferredoxin